VRECSDLNDDLILPAAVLLDMDGTLTKPMLDFPRIKAEMGIGQRPILEALAEMTPAERQAAEAVLDRHEEEAARLSALNPGCRELLDRLAALNIRTALVTRNSPASVRTVVRLHGLEIDVMISRDDARPKPHPEPLLLACGRLEIAPGSAWMVGDGEFDVAAGLAAGVRTVWIRHGRHKPFAARAWREVEDLWELADLLERCQR
jgi:HAD superfamily hydrolase (TIGR01509 family)